MHKEKIIAAATLLVLFLAFFLNYVTVGLSDYDFWWHLATGRYIVETRSLPSEDPFSFVHELDENKKISNPLGQAFNLKQYWLAQIVFYGVHQAFGTKGIIALRGILLTLTTLVLLLWYRKQGTRFFIIFLMLFLSHYVLLLYTGDRPVLFTALFSVLLFYLLDDYKRNRSKFIYLIIPLMLVWANLLGGFIIGIVIIGIFLSGEALNLFVLKKTENKKQFFMLAIVSILAIAASSLNPNGLKAFIALTPKYRDVFQVGTQEYMSPFKLYALKISSPHWAYIVLFALFFFVVLPRWRRVDAAYLVLASGLLYMSADAIRYVLFFGTIGALIIGHEADQLAKDPFEKLTHKWPRIELVLGILLLGSSLLYASGFVRVEKARLDSKVNIVQPDGASNFIRDSHMSGNIYSDMGSGGYLIWKLYPQNQVFTDTRALNYTVLKEYQWIITAKASLQDKELPPGKKPLWERLLDHYRINIVVLNTKDVVGAVPPLILSLLDHPAWAAVYHDLNTIVFVRETSEYRNVIEKHRQKKEDVYNVMIVRYIALAEADHNNPLYLESLGDIFVSMGKYPDALKAYEYSDKRLGDQSEIHTKILAVKGKMKSNDTDKP